MSDTAQVRKTLRDYVDEFSRTMQCNCDLDNWEPERSTGHSQVCRIHKAATQKELANLLTRFKHPSA